MTHHEASVWRDEHPARYGPLQDGCFCVIQGIDEHAHFIRIDLEPGFLRPDARTACGIPFPVEAWAGPGRWQFPMAGVVDCEKCLALSR